MHVNSPQGLGRYANPGMVVWPGVAVLLLVLGGALGFRAGTEKDFVRARATYHVTPPAGPTRGFVTVASHTGVPTQSRNFQGVSLAIPSSLASQVYLQIVKTGSARRRGWLGIHVQQLMHESAGSETQSGVFVSEVVPGGPGDRGGIRSGDIILGFDGKQVHNRQDLLRAIAGVPIGSTSKVTIQRDGQGCALEVKVGERPADFTRLFKTSLRRPLGVTVEGITPEIRDQLSISSTSGALVTEVKPGRAADESGVQPGDVILEINHSPVVKAGDLQEISRGLKRGSSVLLKIERQGKILYLAFELP